MAEPSPLHVPAAQVHFAEEDRRLILERIDQALSTGQLTLGTLGRELEETFASRHGADHAVAVSSGTAAIEIGLRCIGVEGKEVLVAANSFFATAAAVIAAGARPRFVDCDPATMAADPTAVEAAIGPETAGLVLVHIGGLITPDIKRLLDVCEQHDLFLYEDAAHAHGSSLGGRSAGTFGIAGAFSLYPTKVITGGEGGLLITDDAALAEEARTFRDQGKASFRANLHTHLGYNWRLSEPHAAIALSQLDRLDEFIDHRQNAARRYDEALASLSLQVLAVPAAASCNYYKYVAFLPDGVERKELRRQLRHDHGVGLSGEVYELGLHRQPALQPWATEALPRTDELCARHICLPISAVISDEQIDRVVAGLGDGVRPASNHP